MAITIYPVTPSFAARRSHAADRDSSGPLSATTSRTARSVNSGVYSATFGMFESFQRLDTNEVTVQ